MSVTVRALKEPVLAKRVETAGLAAVRRTDANAANNPFTLSVYASVGRCRRPISQSVYPISQADLKAMVFPPSKYLSGLN